MYAGYNPRIKHREGNSGACTTAFFFVPSKKMACVAEACDIAYTVVVALVLSLSKIDRAVRISPLPTRTPLPNVMRSS